MVKYVIMKVGFEENVNEEEINSITSKFYTDNEKEIKGMGCDQLRDDKSWADFKAMYKKFEESNGVEDYKPTRK